MAQDIVNENQKISYTNLDFSSIYTEVLDLVKQLTYRWDPSISDESDPGVILVKLSSLIADKCNYNIDKNILETFPLSVTQNGNARQLYDQLGYYMDWYESASVPIMLSWIGDTSESVTSYTIPKFTAITDSDSSHIYSLIGAEGVNDIIVSDTILPTDGKSVTVIAMEGTPVQYQFENEIVITAQMVDPISRRLYFPHSYVSQNGVFIKSTGQENYASWKRVNNLYENTYNELRYVFGYDSNSDACFLEFPDNYAELFGSGIEITYLVIPQETSNIPAQTLNQFLAPIAVGGDNGIILDSSTVKITNFVAATGHKDIESIDDAYVNYKRTVGTFKTLITLRDYLNYIKSSELDICSNAFVCDRTNDIQSVYKIMSKQHDTDVIVIKVEQLSDNSDDNMVFNVSYRKTTDTTVDSSKTYYELVGNEMVPVSIPQGEVNPKSNGWYELDSVEQDGKDALSPFSLKFYLLRKAIALNSKTAYNETFAMMKPYPDFDSLLSDTSHLEHTYEDILPLGENTYKKSLDDEWLTTKSYWLYEDNDYELITDDSVFDTPPSENPHVYEIDVEAMLPHTVLFKGVYPITLNISTYNVLDTDTHSAISSNIVRSLYESVNSAEIDFGSEISLDYLSEIAKSSDDRIKSVTVDPIEYSLYATYYDKDEDVYVELEIDSDMSNYDAQSYRSLPDIVSAFIKKDIVCKSILAGTTQLLVPDDSFVYHLSQKYVNYVDNIHNVTGEALIDVQRDSVTSYSLDEANSFVRKSYTLKDNEIISLYRPKFNATKSFQNNVHFEYILYNGISANSSYKLGNNEFFILYNPIKDSDSTTVTGYTAYACSTGAIIHSTFEIPAQANVSSLSGFARSRIIPYFTVNPTKNYYETSTYNESYKTEIRNSSSIIRNVISGTDEISIQEISTITLDRADKYKFFWILNEPTYSNDSNLKSYTLFDDFDSVEENQFSETINSYTLRNGEALFYTNENNTDFAMLGPGTTLIRNCGVESSIYTPIENSIYYVDIDSISSLLSDAQIGFLTDDNNLIKPKDNGLYEVVDTPSPEVLDSDANPYALNLYELSENQSGNPLYTFSSSTTVESGVDYYKPSFVRTSDTSLVSGKVYYLLVMRKDAGWYIKDVVTDQNGVENDVYVADEVISGCFKEVDLYSDYTLHNPQELGLYEIVMHNNNKFIDSYKLNSYASVTSQNRFSSSLDTSIIDRNILSNTKYSGIMLDNIGTYSNIDFSSLSVSNPQTLGLLSPIYKKYYVDDTGETEADVFYLSNPSDEGWYEKTGEDTYALTSDTVPVVEGVKKTSDIELLKEINSVFSLQVLNSGYYYKPSSINTVFYYNNSSVPYMDAGVVLTEYEGAYSNSPLQYLYYLYSSTSHPDVLSSDTLLTNISNKWESAITYQPPHLHVEDYDSSIIYHYDDVVKNTTDNLYYKCVVSQASSSWIASEWVQVDNSWAIKEFSVGGTIESMGTAYANKYIKVDSTNIISKSFNVGTIYPSFEGNASLTVSYFYIPASFITNFADAESGLVDTVNYYVMTDNFIYLDTDYKLSSLFPNAKNDVSNYGTIHIYFLPKRYKFNDFVRYTYKNYYEPKVLYNRNCGTIKAWSCTALDNDYIREDPIRNIGELWTTLQANTSLTLIENEIQSFAFGDVLMFEAAESSEAYTDWPVFSNTESILDLNSYKVYYQRSGEDIEELETVAVDDYKWRGYSSLMLNTSNSSGQKLAYNHTLFLYDSEESVIPISVISGSSQTNITFQLKYPVENKSGTFIDVSTTDMLGDDILNSLYAFVPYTNTDDYAYDTSNYNTLLYFNGFDDNNHSRINLPLGLPYGNYLLGIEMKDDVVMEVTNTNYYSGTSSRGVEVGCYIDVPAVSVEEEQSSGDMLYTFSSPYTSEMRLKSYRDDTTTSFVGNAYEYINLEVKGDFVKIKLPSLVTFTFDKSPYELGWYVLLEDEYVIADSSYSDMGSSLLEVVDISEFELSNPSEEGWYEKNSSNYYFLSTDSSIDDSKTYYKEKDFYVNLLSITSNLVFDIYAETTPQGTITYTILDVFKYNNNSALGDGFDTIRNKIRQLDVDGEYNYMFIPLPSDKIENPLSPKSFFALNHVYNPFIIPQLDFDNLNFRFTTTKVNR